VADVNWNCTGWQTLVLFGLTSVFGLSQVRGTRRRVLLVVAGVAGTFAVNVLRIVAIVLLGYFVGYPVALIFHDYAGTALALGWLLAFWSLALNRSSGEQGKGVSPETVTAGL
jgi:exosortase/archaeosortase family protein